MDRTVWLLSLCWQLPERDPDRERLLPILMARLELEKLGRAANDYARRVGS